MDKPKVYGAALAVSLLALGVLAAWGLSTNAIIGRETMTSDSGPQLAIDEVRSTPVEQRMAFGKRATSLDTVHQEAERTQDGPEDEMALSEGEGMTLNQGIALLKIEPFRSPCCPEPTPADAVLAAQAVPGVLAAELLEPETLRVRYDLDQVEILDIKSAISRAAFFVTVADEESDAAVDRAAGIQTWKVLETEIEK